MSVGKLFVCFLFQVDHTIIKKKENLTWFLPTVNTSLFVVRTIVISNPGAKVINFGKKVFQKGDVKERLLWFIAHWPNPFCPKT